MHDLFRENYDIYILAEIFNFLIIPFGILPYKIRKNKKHKMLVYFCDTFISLCISGVSLISYAYVYKEHEEQTKAKKIMKLIKSLRIIGTSLIIVSTIYRKKYFYKTLEKLKYIDNLIGTVSNKVTYKKYVFMILMTMIGCTLIMIVCALSIGPVNSNWLKFNMILLLMYSIYVSGALFSIMGAVNLNILEKILWMEKCLRYIQNPSLQKDKKVTPDVMMKILPEIYHNLFSACLLINQFLNVSGLIMYTIDLMTATLFLNMLFYEQTGDLYDSMLFLLFLGNLLITSIPLMHIGKRITQIGTILGESVHCYTNEKMSNLKNLFLLQLKHEEVQFSICGLFSCNITSILEQMSLAITIIIFLYQVDIY